MALRFTDLKELYLYELYMTTMRLHGNFRFDFESYDPFEGKLSVARHLLNQIGRGLLTSGLIRVNDDDPFDDGPPNEITPKGLEYCEEQLDPNIDEAIPETPLQRAQKRFAEELSTNRNSQAGHTPAENLAPASDRIVSLDHNSEPYKKAIAALDRVTEAARASNELGNEDPNEKERVVAELEAGKRVLESSRVSTSTVRQLIGKTLMWLGEKFSSGLVGQLAQTAWSLIKPLIGL